MKRREREQRLWEAVSFLAGLIDRQEQLIAAQCRATAGIVESLKLMSDNKGHLNSRISELEACNRLHLEGDTWNHARIRTLETVAIARNLIEPKQLHNHVVANVAEADQRRAAVRDGYPQGTNNEE